MPFPTKRYTFTHESQCPQLQSPNLTPSARKHVVEALGLLDSTALVVAELATSYEEHRAGTVCARFVGSQGVTLVVYAGPEPLQNPEPDAPSAGDGQLNLGDLSEPTVPDSDETLLSAARAELESANAALEDARRQIVELRDERDLQRELKETAERQVAELRQLLDEKTSPSTTAPNDV